PKRPVLGFDCERSEVSGRRLWGLFAERFGTAKMFFTEHFVANYCPLAFMDDEGRNITPDKLPAAETKQLQAACDRNLREIAKILSPEWVIGIGAYGERRARSALGEEIQYGRILHPSPANPLANKGWAAFATAQLVKLGVWQ
ncbi:MAG: single-stranded DNA-binding protein, partial [Opitutales bacterium]